MHDIPPSEPPMDAQAAPAEEPAVYKVYKPPTVSSEPLPILSDDYFTPTTTDIQISQSQLASRSEALNNAPLQLKAVREAQEKAKRDRFPNTKVRIRFTDGTQLERVFPSTDKIKSIYVFVRNSLREDVKPIKFILVQPPKRELKVSDPNVRNLTLAELQLAPSSMFLVKFLDDSLNGSAVAAPLAANILSQAVDLPAPPDVTDIKPIASSSFDSTTQASKEKKIPKWLLKGLNKK